LNLAQALINLVYGGKASSPQDAYAKLVSGLLGIPASSYSFDTGGYTGAWGKDGKLALLH